MKKYKPDFKQLDLLTSQGYLRKVISDCNSLVLYNYTDKCVFKRKWNKHTLHSRGNVYELSTGKVVARAFPKFFNYEELSKTRSRCLMRKTNFEVFEKIDGSLGIIYNYNNEVKINTRGSFSSDQAVRAKEISKKYKFLDKLEHLTLLVEIIYPENQIIVDYGDRNELILLGAYNTTTGEELNYTSLLHLGKMTKMPVARRYLFASIEDVVKRQLELSNNFSKDGEGFVVKFEDGYRVKFKSKEYLELARRISKITPLEFWSQMEKGKVSQQFIESLPEEFRDKVEHIQNALEKRYSDLHSQIILEWDSIKEIVKGSDNLGKTVTKLIKDRSLVHGSSMYLLMYDKIQGLDQFIMKKIRPNSNIL